MFARWLFFFYFVPVMLFALYNGNPSLPMMPEQGFFIAEDAPLGLKMGYEMDWVYDCRLQLDQHPLPKKRSHHFNSLTQFGVVTLNINDRVEVFGDMGTLSCQWNYDQKGNRLAYKGESFWAWGLGGRALLAYWGDIQLTINASYARSRESMTHLKLNGHSHPREHAKILWTPWQIGAGVSYRAGAFVPYVGLDYTHLLVEATQLRSLKSILPRQRATFVNDIPFGVFLGLGWGPRTGGNVNVEGRFIQENGCSVSVDLKF